MTDFHHCVVSSDETAHVQTDVRINFDLDALFERLMFSVFSAKFGRRIIASHAFSRPWRGLTRNFRIAKKKEESPQ